MRFFKIAAAIAVLALSAAGCAQFKEVTAVLGTVSTASNTPVPASAVIVAANSFDILKSGATAFARYCVQNGNTPAPCSVSNRRLVVKAVRAGTQARDVAEASLAAGSSVTSTVYNTLTAAVTQLKRSPAQSYAGGSQ